MMSTEVKSNPAAPSRSRWLVWGFWIAVVAWMCLVTWLSSKPSTYFPKITLPNADKIVHLFLYTTGAIFTAMSLLLSFRWDRRVVFVITVVLISLFGVLDEYHQLSTPGRSGGDVGDWTADTLGAIVGVSLVRIALDAWKNRKREVPVVKPASV